MSRWKMELFHQPMIEMLKLIEWIWNDKLWNRWKMRWKQDVLSSSLFVFSWHPRGEGYVMREITHCEKDAVWKVHDDGKGHSEHAKLAVSSFQRVTSARNQNQGCLKAAEFQQWKRNGREEKCLKKSRLPSAERCITVPVEIVLGNEWVWSWSERLWDVFCSCLSNFINYILENPICRKSEWFPICHVKVCQRMCQSKDWNKSLWSE